MPGGHERLRHLRRHLTCHWQADLTGGVTAAQEHCALHVRQEAPA